MKETDILHENGDFWVCNNPNDYTVYRIGVTHSVVDSSYEKTPDGLSIAKARCDYLASRQSLHQAPERSARTAELHPHGVLTKNHEKPLADAPFASYRIPGRFGWIMIAAMNAQDAMSEAGRSNSTNYKLACETLEIWDGEKYINALYFP